MKFSTCVMQYTIHTAKCQKIYFHVLHSVKEKYDLCYHNYHNCTETRDTAPNTE